MQPHPTPASGQLPTLTFLPRLLRVRVSAALRPSTWVPPSTVLMEFTKEMMVSLQGQGAGDVGGVWAARGQGKPWVVEKGDDTGVAVGVGRATYAWDGGWGVGRKREGTPSTGLVELTWARVVLTSHHITSGRGAARWMGVSGVASMG